MARPIWSGSVSFGLVTVPVELYSATGDHNVRFRQYERGTSDRVRYRKVNERTGKEVGSDDIVKGYEYSDGEVVLVEPTELSDIAPGRSRTIEISAFADLSAIDPVYFSNSYFLAPSKEEFAKAYQLLMRAMTKTGMAGIARFVMRGREHLAAIRAGEQVLMMDTMRYAEDVRNPEEELRSLPERAEVGSKELDMAVDLIESMHEDWAPEDYPDTYTDRVLELIESKREGREVVTESAPPEPTNVVDLFDALSRSVEGKGSKGSTGSKASKDGTGSKASKNGQAGKGEAKGTSKQAKAGTGSKGAKSGTDAGARAQLSELSKSELESMARELGIKGRSKMNRAELESALQSVNGQAPTPKRRKAS